MIADQFEKYILDPTPNHWCMTCHQFVGEEKLLQHIYPGKHPEPVDCGPECAPDHFFYYYHCPICHRPRLINKKYYESFLPLADGEDVDYCDACQDITRVREKDHETRFWLCKDCWEDKEMLEEINLPYTPWETNIEEDHANNE